MNYIRAKVSDIQGVEHLHIISFEASGQKLSMVSLELNDVIKVGSEVRLGVKASNIFIAKETQVNLSIATQLKVKIKALNFGELLCAISFDFAGETLESIITKEMCLTMDLAPEDEILALIKSTDLSIIEVL